MNWTINEYGKHVAKIETEIMTIDCEVSEENVYQTFINETFSHVYHFKGLMCINAKRVFVTYQYGNDKDDVLFRVKEIIKNKIKQSLQEAMQKVMEELE